MKTTLQQKQIPQITYPILMEVRSSPGYIILFTERKKGIRVAVPSTMSNTYAESKLFEFDTSLSDSENSEIYRPYTGKVILEN